MSTRRPRSRPAPTLTRDAQAWADAWREAKGRSPVNLRERHGPQAEIRRWDLRADTFARHADSPASRQRRQWVLDWLAAEGALAPGGRVLDIGAGPGTFALPLAETAAEVVALEPAEGMCAVLRRRIREQGAANVRIEQRAWEEVDLAASGWKGAFDLGFASMSPGVSSPEALERMQQASRAWCYLSGWSGARWGKWGLAQEELWPLLFDEPLGDYPSDVLYPFGLLYATGRRPQLRFERPLVRLEMPADEAAAELAGHFDRYLPVDERVRQVIGDYVAMRSSGGVFRQEFHTCRGFMLWRV